MHRTDSTAPDELPANAEEFEFALVDDDGPCTLRDRARPREPAVRADQARAAVVSSVTLPVDGSTVPLTTLRDDDELEKTTVYLSGSVRSEPDSDPTAVLRPTVPRVRAPTLPGVGPYSEEQRPAPSAADNLPTVPRSLTPPASPVRPVRLVGTLLGSPRPAAQKPLLARPPTIPPRAPAPLKAELGTKIASVPPPPAAARRTIPPPPIAPPLIAPPPIAPLLSEPSPPGDYTSANYWAAAARLPQPQNRLPSSIAPVSLGHGSVVPPSPGATTSRRALKTAALGALVGSAFSLCAIALLRPPARTAAWAAATQADTGSLVFTASRQDNQTLGQLRVLVDDVPRCERSPCRVPDLLPGAHTVRVVAPGELTTATRTVTVNPGAEAGLHLEFVNNEVQAAVSPALPEPPRPRISVPAPSNRPLLSAEPRPRATPKKQSIARMDREPPRRKKQQRSAQEPAASPAPKALASAPTTASLRISSAPPSAIVVDGRPLGRTASARLSVGPGVHTVVFIHADGRRRVQVTKVVAGDTRGVSVRF